MKKLILILLSGFMFFAEAESAINHESMIALFESAQVPSLSDTVTYSLECLNSKTAILNTSREIQENHVQYKRFNIELLGSIIEQDEDTLLKYEYRKHLYYFATYCLNQTPVVE